ncbi:MAG: hypothetical protein QM817_06315 [Archangium sp.]
MSRILLFAFVAALAACGSTTSSGPATHLLGRVNSSSFPLEAPVAIEASSDDGRVVRAELAADGSFDLALGVDGTWELRVFLPNGGGHQIAIAREGHFDRGFVTQGVVTARLGVVWLPPAGTTDVWRITEEKGDTCVEGRLADGSACVVVEAIVSCADGPRRPTDDPTSLLLGAGEFVDLPGSERGVRYALASRAPPPILYECPPLTPP